MESLSEDDHSTEWDDLSQGPQPETYGDEEDITDVRALRELARSYFEKRHAMAPEQASKEAHNVADTQQGFLQQCRRDRERGQETSKEEFLKWEQEYAYNWNRMQEYILESGMGVDAEAEAELPIFFSTDKEKIKDTIEAQSGKYYDERMWELRRAITASDGKTQESDMRLLGTFFHSVMAHVEFRYFSPADIREQYGDDVDAFNTFDRARTAAHNAVIKHLNAINALAEKYGTTRFTPRNFWTSERMNQTPEVSRRMDFDRKAVELYYMNAFSYDIDKKDQEMKRPNALKLTF
jgi:hypothetical protein